MNTEQHETKRGYHFTADKLRNGDPIPAIGEWISVSGPVIPCKSGLHMSEHPYDALRYSPGCKLHLVEIRVDIQSHGDPVDKWVGRERRIIATIDATAVLRVWGRWCALEVAHLWDCPDIVRRYLETGDESIRAEAWAEALAAWEPTNAAGSAVWAAYRAASGDASNAALAASNAASDAGLAAFDAKREKLQTLVNEEFKKELSK